MLSVAGLVLIGGVGVVAPWESTAGGTCHSLATVGSVVDGHDWDPTVTESDAGGARFEMHVNN